MNSCSSSIEIQSYRARGVDDFLSVSRETKKKLSDLFPGLTVSKDEPYDVFRLKWLNQKIGFAVVMPTSEFFTAQLVVWVSLPTVVEDPEPLVRNIVSNFRNGSTGIPGIFYYNVTSPRASASYDALRDVYSANAG